MQICLKFKTILAISLALLFIACNNDKHKRVTVQEVTLQDIKQEESVPEPPPPPPPKAEIPAAVKKCYANDGLKYKTVVTLLFYKKNGVDIVSGNVSSEELGSGKIEKGVFEGTINADKFTIKFVGNPPTAGDASEWTDKPWAIKKAGGKETLHIIFNAKNYETNNWEDTDYQFVLVDCK